MWMQDDDDDDDDDGGSPCIANVILVSSQCTCRSHRLLLHQIAHK